MTQAGAMRKSLPISRRARRGVTLPELLVAMVLASLLAAGGAAAMLTAERYLRQVSGKSDAQRTVREVTAVLAAELRTADADSLRIRGDTAVDFLGLIGTSVACIATPDSALVLPPDVTTLPSPLTVWRGTPATGDLVVVYDTSAGGHWQAARLALVSSSSSATGGCLPADGLFSSADSAARRPVTRLALDRLLPPGIGAGAPVRVMRRGRYLLFRGSDHAWALAYRSCDAVGVCGTAQPVAGPLAAVADSGLVFARPAGTSQLMVTVRGPPPGGTGAASGLAASHRLLLTVRNHANGLP